MSVCLIFLFGRCNSSNVIPQFLKKKESSEHLTKQVDVSIKYSDFFFKYSYTWHSYKILFRLIGFFGISLTFGNFTFGNKL
jgi:hypothetical protein